MIGHVHIIFYEKKALQILNVYLKTTIILKKTGGIYLEGIDLKLLGESKTN